MWSKGCNADGINSLAALVTIVRKKVAFTVLKLETIPILEKVAIKNIPRRELELVVVKCLKGKG